MTLTFSCVSSVVRSMIQSTTILKSTVDKTLPYLTPGLTPNGRDATIANTTGVLLTEFSDDLSKVKGRQRPPEAVPVSLLKPLKNLQNFCCVHPS